MLSTPTVLQELPEINLQLHDHFHLHPVKLVQITHITSYDNKKLELVIKLSKDEDMPLNKTPSPFFPAGKFQQFSDRRCWGLERFRSQVRKMDPGGKSLWLWCFGTREVGSCDLFLELLFWWFFGFFAIGKSQWNHNLSEWFSTFLEAFLCKSKSMSDIGQLVIASCWARFFFGEQVTFRFGRMLIENL